MFCDVLWFAPGLCCYTVLRITAAGDADFPYSGISRDLWICLTHRGIEIAPPIAPSAARRSRRAVISSSDRNSSLSAGVFLHTKPKTKHPGTRITTLFPWTDTLVVALAVFVVVVVFVPRPKIPPPLLDELTRRRAMRQVNVATDIVWVSICGQRRFTRPSVGLV